jgi:hypothetical protein
MREFRDRSGSSYRTGCCNWTEPTHSPRSWISETGRGTTPEGPKYGLHPVPNQPYFVRLQDFGRATLAAATVDGIADPSSHRVLMVAAAGAVVEGVHRYRRLTDNEIGVFNVLRRLVQGGSIYKVWIAQDRLLDAMDSEMDRDDRERLLANMKSKGILDEGANKWRAVW